MARQRSWRSTTKCRGRPLRVGRTKWFGQRRGDDRTVGGKPVQTTTEWFDLTNGRSPLEGTEGRIWPRNVGRYALFLYEAQLSSFVAAGAGQIVNAVRDSLEQLAGGLGESTRVSDRMNTFFRQMASARARQTASVSKVWITSEFRIVVSGDDGAVRRASELPYGLRQVLAISFVLAVMERGRTECVLMDDPLPMLNAELAAPTLRRVSQEIPQLLLAVNPRPSLADEVFDTRVGRTNTLHARCGTIRLS